MLRALGALGVRVMMHSGALTRSIGAGRLDAVPHPAHPPQFRADQREQVRQAVREQLTIPPRPWFCSPSAAPGTTRAAIWRWTP
ncbi:hypothetical protein ACFP9V_09905 [Deinococcus radiopugnans]|uniref:hypothetical protein n=1 Tax=Deinococcus radiopugnans TaxID=57497 RepID=UPI003605ED7C